MERCGGGRAELGARVAVGWVGDDHDAGARDGSGECDHGTSLDDQPRDAGAAAPGEGLDDSRGAPDPGLGVPHGPVERRGRSQRRRGGAQRRPGSVDEPADRATGEAERARELVVTRAVERGADDHLALEVRKGSDSRECGTGLHALLDELVDRDRGGGVPISSGAAAAARRLLIATLCAMR